MQAFVPTAVVIASAVVPSSSISFFLRPWTARPDPASVHMLPWESAHRGKWGQLTPQWKMYEKLKSENMQKKEQFSMFMLYFESNHGRQV